MHGGEVRMLQMTTVSHITNGCGGFTNGSSSACSNSGCPTKHKRQWFVIMLEAGAVGGVWPGNIVQCCYFTLRSSCEVNSMRNLLLTGYLLL